MASRLFVRGAARLPGALPVARRQGAAAGARRRLATDSGGMTKEQVVSLKKNGAYAAAAMFLGGLGYRIYQHQTGAPADKAGGTTAAPTAEALDAEVKKSVVHWDGEPKKKPEAARPESPAAAPPAATAAPAAEEPEEAEPSPDSAAGMKLLHDLSELSSRLAAVEKAVGVPEQTAITHVVVLKLKPEATAEDKAAILAGLRALPAKIPQIRGYSCGADLGTTPPPTPPSLPFRGATRRDDTGVVSSPLKDSCSAPDRGGFGLLLCWRACRAGPVWVRHCDRG